MMTAVLGMVVAGTGQSQAGTLSLSFDLGGSNLNLADGLVTVPGGGGSVAGSVNVTLNGVNSLGMVTGMGVGTVSSFAFSAMINNAVLPGIVTIVGSINVAQIGVATGGFDGAQLNLGTNQFQNALSGVVDCNGAGCGAVGVMFPVPVGGTIANASGPFPINLAGLSASGAGMFNAMVAANQNGQNVVINFIGNEVARNFMGGGGDGGGGQVPEPLQSGMLVLGIGMLAGLAFALRRRTANV